MGRPLASSSISLSMRRMVRVSGSSIASIRTPQIVPVIAAAFGWIRGASRKNVARSLARSICVASPLAS